MEMNALNAVYQARQEKTMSRVYGGDGWMHRYAIANSALCDLVTVFFPFL
jgi:hypothetical protein